MNPPLRILGYLFAGVAGVLSFFSFMFRADSWQEVADARRFNFVLVGPLWAAAVFLVYLAKDIRRFRIAILVGCLGYIVPASCLSLWTATVAKVRFGPEITDSDARAYIPLVQAIQDYRAEKGMKPYSFDDLVPDYLPSPPEDQRLRLESRWLLLRHKILYLFDEGEEGWTQSVSLPKVEASRPVPPVEKRVEARLAEYEKRIRKDPTNADHRMDQIAYLKELGWKADALTASKLAAKAFPEQWRFLMGTAFFDEQDKRGEAERALCEWFDAHPAFIRYCCLSLYLRELNRPADAIQALRKAVKWPLEDVEGERYVPSAFAMDAANFAYAQKEYALAVEIATVWSSPQGVHSNPGEEYLVFRAAALLALGKLDEARTDMRTLYSQLKGRTNIWAKNLDALERAVEAGDSAFIYNPGNGAPLRHWEMFPSSQR